VWGCRVQREFCTWMEANVVKIECKKNARCSATVGMCQLRVPSQSCASVPTHTHTQQQQQKNNPTI